MFHVYTATFSDSTYVGSTSNMQQRLYVHKARYNNKTHGSNCYVYKVFRSITESFEDIEWTIIKSFRSKEAAKKYEIKMIEKIGNLNTLHSK